MKTAVEIMTGKLIIGAIYTWALLHQATHPARPKKSPPIDGVPG